MEKGAIHLHDFNRILFGEAPPIFLVEVFFRTLITYVLLLLIVRWLGKRMSGQLTIMEMAVMITLGAIVSVPMQVPDRGLLQGLLLLLLAVLFQRGISYWGFKSHSFETFAQGKPSLMVKDGILQLEDMRKERISKQQLFSRLRGEKIFNLGEVERVYLEAFGGFSIFKYSEARPGLPVYPPIDKEILDNGLSANDPNETWFACSNCGLADKDADHSCKNCGANEWTKAIN